MIKTIGAFHGNSGRIPGAENGAKRLKKYLDCKNRIVEGPEIESQASNIDALQNFYIQLRDQVNKSLAEGYFTVILGGDHSIAIGSIAGATYENHVDTGIIYIDAHADMNTFKTSPTGNIHGMPLAICLGEEKLMTGIMTCNLSPNNLLLIGQRSIDSGERDLINRRHIKCVRTESIKINQIEGLESEFNKFIRNNNLNRIHLSFDIDIIDPQYAPGTGVPEANGISPEVALSIIEIALNTGLVRSIDFVEYNPILDIQDKTYKLYKKIIDRVCNHHSLLNNHS